MDYYTLTATEANARFADGSLTVETYAKSLLSRIEERDSKIKAWEYLDPDYVIQEAKRLDQIPIDQRGPLHGVAIAVKDVIHTRDMPTKHGSQINEGDDSKLDAASVTILKNCGALILGKVTTTEFSVTQVGTKTGNACDPTRTPGGSSSGSAAAVGDFQAPIALGTQTAGSVIRPASFNGIYGFKPTWNSLTREGQKIHSLIMDTLGFFARNVGDLELMADAFALADDVPPNPQFSIKGAKFALVKTSVWSQAGPGTIAAMDRCAQLLRDHGAEVEEVELPSEFDQLPRWHEIIIAADGRVSFLREYRVAKEKLHQIMVDMVENKKQISRAAQLEAFDGIASLRPKIDKIAGQYAAIIAPSAVDVAPAGLSWTGTPAMNVVWTSLHTPITNVPGLSGESGMPVGVSLIAPRYHDRHLLTVTKKVGEILKAAKN